SPLQLPALPAEDVTGLRVQKDGEEYRLTHKDGAWKVAEPFEASALSTLVQPMADELANLHVERYETHAAKDLAKYGLDKPHLRLTLELAPKKDDAGKDGKEKDKEAREKKEPAKDRVLLVGKPTDKDDGSRYAKLADGDAVFVVGSKLLAAVDRGAL